MVSRVILRYACSYVIEDLTTGFLPELFARWNEKGASHLVTIILFARVHYTDEEVAYLEENDITLGLSKDYSGRWSKDFFRVVVDFERRTDWNLALTEIKRRVDRSEREILLDFHLAELERQHPGTQVKKRVVGQWSFVSLSLSFSTLRVNDRRTKVTCWKRLISP